MWYLTNSAGKRIYFKLNKELTFGRKKSDILLRNDESISRIHGSICIEPKDIIEMNEPTSICKLKDAGSKYGTYILSGEEWMEVPPAGYNLKDQNKIRFGLQHHTFTVFYTPIITVVSALSNNDKIKLQSLMDEIDGMISTNWTSNCTHLTVSKATLTEKVTWAMAAAIPIVTLDYWEQVNSAVNNGEELPQTNEFVPLISEALVNKVKVSLCPNKKRKTLFENLIFVHFSPNQYKMYGKMISIAGGKSVLYSKRPLNHKELCASNVIVVQYPPNDATQSTQCIVPEYDSIYNALQANNRQMISESDIPLAILHCSVEKYCNPMFKFGEFFKRSQVKPDSSEVLAIDTQDVTSDVRVLPKIISNVSVKSGISIKTPKCNIKIIPESYDISSSDNLLIDNNNTCGSQGSTFSAPKESQRKKDTFNDDILVVKETVKNAEEVCSERIIKYIPETNDSSMSDTTQKDTQCISQKLLTLKEQNINTQNIDVSKKSTSDMTQKGTQCISQKVPTLKEQNINTRNIDVSKKSTSDMTQKGTQCISQKVSTLKEQNINTRNIDVSKKSTSDMTQKGTQCISQKVPILKEQNINTQNVDVSKELMVVNRGTPFHEIIDVSAESVIESKGTQSVESNGNSNNICTEKKSRTLHDVNNVRGKSPEIETINVITHRKNQSNSLKGTSPTVKEKHQKSKRSRDFYESNEEFITFSNKRNCLEDLEEEDSIESPIMSSTPCNEKQERQSNHGTLLRSTSSFLRVCPNYKRFRKMYNSTLMRRISLSDMYVWEKCNLQNLSTF